MSDSDFWECKGLSASEIRGSLAKILKFRITDFQWPFPTLIFSELITMSVSMADTDLNIFKLGWK